MRTTVLVAVLFCAACVTSAPLDGGHPDEWEEISTTIELSTPEQQITTINNWLSNTANNNWIQTKAKKLLKDLILDNVVGWNHLAPAVKTATTPNQAKDVEEQIQAWIGDQLAGAMCDHIMNWIVLAPITGLSLGAGTVGTWLIGKTTKAVVGLAICPKVYHILCKMGDKITPTLTDPSDLKEFWKVIEVQVCSGNKLDEVWTKISEGGGAHALPAPQIKKGMGKGEASTPTAKIPHTSQTKNTKSQLK
jgi:hypothetical protein